MVDVAQSGGSQGPRPPGKDSGSASPSNQWPRLRCLRGGRFRTHDGLCGRGAPRPPCAGGGRHRSSCRPSGALKLRRPPPAGGTTGAGPTGHVHGHTAAADRGAVLGCTQRPCGRGGTHTSSRRSSFRVLYVGVAPALARRLPGMHAPLGGTAAPPRRAARVVTHAAMPRRERRSRPPESPRRAVP